ncbi:VCBS repeat-containing protein [Alkalibacillus sp. S2W]|uniref:VCBS repeat-containing protein n=1 Tax=Alkalibacillus sp. S2W TaxID=3386553 RepID=UPI00398CBCDA
MQYEVATMVYGDVTGDGVFDVVIVWGWHKPDTPYWEGLTIDVQNGVTGEIARQPLSQSEGYDPSIWLGDVTGNGVDDIVLTIQTGGSGATINAYVFQYEPQRLATLFDSEQFQNQYAYQVNYQDQYLVHVLSQSNQELYSIDLSLRPSEYLNEIYDQDGVLLEPIEGWVNPMSGLYPVDFDGDGVYELMILQRIAGRYNADAIGYVQTVLDWQDNYFELSQQYVEVFGQPNV